MIQPSYGVFWP